MEARVVIKKPILSEKNTALSESQNKYCFRVDRNATKIEIARAVEQLFKVKVTSVNTSFVRGKKKRVRFREGKTPDWKKAIVTLARGNSIDYT